MRLNLALLLVVAWAVDIWFLLTGTCIWGGYGKSNLPVDRVALTLAGAHLAPQRVGPGGYGAFPDAKTRDRGRGREHRRG
jgi:hypothetical protein